MLVDLWDGSAAQVQAFEMSAGVDQSVLLHGGKTSGVARTFAADLDHVFIIDGTGIIRYEYARIDGYPAWRPDDLRPIVEAALESSVPAAGASFGAIKALYR